MSYRYHLTRRWAFQEIGPCGLWIMLNPSTADETKDDPTIRKCIGFGKRWGWSAFTVMNLFAARATQPRDLAIYADPVGEDTDRLLQTAMHSGGPTVVAWGSFAQHYPERVAQVLALAPEGAELQCLGRSKQGHPRHPLMLSYDTPLERYEDRK